MHSCLALDFGASSGRLMAVDLSNDVFSLRELARMKNGPEKRANNLAWAHERLFAEVEAGLCKAGECAETFTSIGVDAWGVDYVLLDENHNVLGLPVSYRDPRTEGMVERFERDCMPLRDLYQKTGIQILPINTLFQLYAQTLLEPELLKKAKHLVFTPDYYHFLLTGNIGIERSIASTSQMLNINDGSWDSDLLAKLALPQSALADVVPAGTDMGALTSSLTQKTELSGLRVIAPASHDTASAVLATPVRRADEAGDWAYLSSGTWSLMGVETTTPITGDDAMRANWTNESGYGDTYRFLKNIIGLWIIQELARDLDGKYSFAQLAAAAEEEQAYRSLINPNDPRFFNPACMTTEIQNFCKETGQPVPDGPGALARCAYDSLSLLYRKVFLELEELRGGKINVLHVLGGGSKAHLLNQLTADALGVQVLAGPEEATALGNALAQFLSAGVISSLAEARALVAHSFPVQTYEPRAETTHTERIKEAYQRFAQF